jgi:hypothetical protein
MADVIVKRREGQKDGRRRERRVRLRKIGTVQGLFGTVVRQRDAVEG